MINRKCYHRFSIWLISVFEVASYSSLTTIEIFFIKFWIYAFVSVQVVPIVLYLISFSASDCSWPKNGKNVCLFLFEKWIKYFCFYSNTLLSRATDLISSSMLLVRIFISGGLLIFFRRNNLVPRMTNVTVPKFHVALLVLIYLEFKLTSFSRGRLDFLHENLSRKLYAWNRVIDWNTPGLSPWLRRPDNPEVPKMSLITDLSWISDACFSISTFFISSILVAYKLFQHFRRITSK